MSAPDVNIERQKKRHRPMIRSLWVGLALIVVVSVGVLLANSLFDTGPAALIPDTSGTEG